MNDARWLRALLISAAVASLPACDTERLSTANETPQRPSILLVTLDTTRADSIGPDAAGVETPAFNRLAQEGMLFTQAYATVPETLPSHSSMMTGLYPAAHGVHENARRLANRHTVIAESLREAGYRTAAFVSAFPLERRFGLARGFDTYDDLLNGRAERSASETAARVVDYLNQVPSREPLFLWVHFYDPHYPYEPAEPFRTRYAKDPYRGEVAAMDEQLGRIVEAFRGRSDDDAGVIVVADHGESLGEHGEAQHGHLVYQGAMHVPLVIAKKGISPARIDAPVSIRRVFHTIRTWAGLGGDDSLDSSAAAAERVVMGEGMKPFLDYGWQPQVMAVDGSIKVIRAGRIEAYDIRSDPKETADIANSVTLTRELRRAIRDYPDPQPAGAESTAPLSDEDRRQLASLGYVSADAAPAVRADAPRPAEMVHLIDDLDRASGLFVREQYREAIPLLETVLAQDPGNLMTALRLGAAQSAVGNSGAAIAAFEKAKRIAPDSIDVAHYTAMHHVARGEWPKAEPLLERVLGADGDRIPAIEAMIVVRQRQGRYADALTMFERLRDLRPLSGDEQLRRGLLAMQMGKTVEAIEAMEAARLVKGDGFRNDLELGVLYLDARRFTDAREALDRIPATHPAYPMVLFKRAQVSVLLQESDRDRRIAEARERADASTRQLIEREPLFRGN